MIPSFPGFAPLSLDLKDDLRAITIHYPSYSDYGFTSLWSYDTESSARVSLLNQNLVLHYSDYLTGEQFYSFLGATQVDETANTLIRHASKSGVDTTLKLIPQTVIDCVAHPEQFIITEDRDNHDYILSVEELAEMKGGHHERKRNLIRTFLSAYQHEMRMEPLRLSNAEVRAEIIQTFKDWAISRGKASEEISIELEAITRLLNNHDKFDIKTIGVFINNRLRGFSVYELIHDNHGVVHYEKADINFEGIFYYLKQEVAKEMRKHGATHINYEQDLGLEGLRNSKSMLNPVHFLKKYSLCLAPAP